jgi:hypothetical protein
MAASTATGARLRLLPLGELGVKVAASTAWEILKKAGIDPRRSHFSRSVRRGAAGLVQAAAAEVRRDALIRVR